MSIHNAMFINIDCILEKMPINVIVSDNNINIPNTYYVNKKMINLKYLQFF